MRPHQRASRASQGRPKAAPQGSPLPARLARYNRGGDRGRRPSSTVPAHHGLGLVVEVEAGETWCHAPAARPARSSSSEL